MFQSDAERLTTPEERAEIGCGPGDKDFNSVVFALLLADWKEKRQLLKEVLESPVHSIDAWPVCDKPHLHLKEGLVERITTSLSRKDK